MNIEYFKQIENVFTNYINKLIFANNNLFFEELQEISFSLNEDNNYLKQQIHLFKYWRNFFNSLLSIFSDEVSNVFFMDFASLSVIIDEAPLSIDEQLVIICKIISENRKITKRFEDEDMMCIDSKAKNFINETENFYSSFIDNTDALTTDSIKTSIDSLEKLGVNKNTLMSIEEYLTKNIMNTKTKTM